MNKISVISEIVNQKQYQEIDGIIVDLQTATAIMAVYNGLNDINKKKYAKMAVDKMARIAWKLIEPS